MHDPDSFFVTGGSLRADAPSYVERRADVELYDGLSRGEFCYVLTPRQMGKSSLRVRIAARLRDEGACVVALDLSALGQNLSPEQWYYGLLDLVGEQCGLEDALDAFWKSHRGMGPLRRLMAALREVVLSQAADRHVAKVVVFIDEIDIVRGLSFPTDEFFAAIRECYNRRTEDPEMDRLTFCLLGVAAPSDLIRDTRMTPFNIGRRIELEDFTGTEASGLTKGLRQNSSTCRQLLDRILHWTGGHPYLTQRFCHAVARLPALTGNAPSMKAAVDGACRDLFLSHRAQERDDNLIFVRERILKSEADLAALLEIYDSVCRGRRVPDDDTNPLLGFLRLAGVTRVVDGFLQVRNRIYARTFDRQWVRNHMPDAERQRQRIAYRRGVLRAATVGAGIVVAIGFLAAAAAVSARRAQEARQLADGRAVTAQHLTTSLELSNERLSAANRALSSALTATSLERARADKEATHARESARMELMQEQQARKEEGIAIARTAESRRSLVRFEVANGMRLAEENDLLGALPWLADALKHDRGDKQREETHRIRLASVLNLCPTLIRLYRPGGPIGAVLSRDGRKLATADNTGRTMLWDVERGSCIPLAARHRGPVTHVSFSLDGRRVVTAGWDHTARVWDADTGRPISPPLRHDGPVAFAVFSADGRRVATASHDHTARIWDWVTGRALTAPLRHGDGVVSVGFNPDGTRLITASLDHSARIWDAVTAQEIGPLLTHDKAVLHAVFSPDGRSVVTASADHTARIWDADTGRPLGNPLLHEESVNSAVFSPDGRRIVTTSDDSTARVWDAVNGSPISPALRHDQPVTSAAFSDDGRRVVTASLDQTARVWYANSGRPIGPPLRHGNWVTYAGFLPDGRVCTASLDQAARLWSLPSEVRAARVLDTENRSYHSSFSRDCRRVVSAAGAVVVLDPMADGRIQTLRGAINVAYAEMSPDGRRIVTVRGNDTARVWDAASGNPISKPLSHGGPITCAAFSPDGSLVATASYDRTARVWDAVTGRPLTPPLHQSDPVYSVAFSPDGRRIVTACQFGTVSIWNVASGRLAAPLMRHSGDVLQAAFSDDGRRLVTASADGTARVWDAGTGRPVSSPLVHGGGVLFAAFRSDGRAVVTASRDGTARVWDCLTGQPLTMPMHHGGDVVRAAFSPDGRRIVTASRDGSARVWDATTGEPITPPLRHSEAVIAAAFSPDGRRVVSASEDGAVGVWDIAPDSGSVESLLRAARSLAGSRINERTGADPIQVSAIEKDWRASCADRSRDPAAYRVQAASWRREESDYYLRRARRETQLLRHPEALADYAQAIELDPSRAAGWFSRAGAEGTMRQFERALADYSKVLELSPNNAKARYFRGNTNRFLRRWPEAEDDLTQALALEPDPNAWQSRGYVRLALGKWRAAISDFSRTIAAIPDETSARVNRARAHIQIGELARAAADYAAAADLASHLPGTDSGLWHEKALLHLHRSDLAGYRATCAVLMKRFRDVEDPGIANNVAWTCALGPRGVGDYTPVLRMAETAVAGRRSYENINTLGTLLYRAGRYTDSIQRITEACDLSKGGHAPDWLILAMANQRLGREDDARRWLDRAAPVIDALVRQKPSHPAWIEILEDRVMLAEARSLIAPSAR